MDGTAEGGMWESGSNGPGESNQPSHVKWQRQSVENGGNVSDQSQARVTHEGHGDHWGTVVENPPEGILPVLRQAAEEGIPGGGMASPLPGFRSIQELHHLHAGEVGTRVLLGEGEGSMAMLTAFPFTPQGSVQPVEVSRVHRWRNCLEATVEANFPEAGMFGFFQVDHHLHPETLVPGATLEVVLSAFAYHLEPAEDQELLVTQEMTIRTLRGASEGVPPELVTDLGPIVIRTRGLTCMVPWKGGEPDDLEIRGPVEAIDLLEAWGEPLYRLQVRVHREEPEVVLPVYARARTFREGKVPRVGDEIQGVVWLQGRIATQADKPLSSH